MYCLVKDGKAIEGHTLYEAVYSASGFEIDYSKRVVSVPSLNIKQDTVSYSDEYTAAEMVRAATDRVLTLLERSGWRLYKRYE